MTELTIFEKNGDLWTDSREVAAMVDKRHDHLVRDIKRYIDAIEKSNVPKVGDVQSDGFKVEAVDFFVPSSYVDEKGEPRPCFQISKKGCELVGNKLTGDKGVLFTAAYVTRFNEMERTIKAGSLAFPAKATSAGEVARVLHEERSTMIAERSNPRKIARQVEMTLKHFGLPVIADFVEREPPNQMHF